MNEIINSFFQEWLLKNSISIQDKGILAKVFKDAFLLGLNYKVKITAQEYLQK